MTEAAPAPIRAPIPAPIIVTARFGRVDQAWFDALRQRHFPPERNHLAAHLTMFHHLPPSVAPELKQRLAAEVRGYRRAGGPAGRPVLARPRRRLSDRQPRPGGYPRPDRGRLCRRPHTAGPGRLAPTRHRAEQGCTVTGQGAAGRTHTGFRPAHRSDQRAGDLVVSRRPVGVAVVPSISVNGSGGARKPLFHSDIRHFSACFMKRVPKPPLFQVEGLPPPACFSRWR